MTTAESPAPLNPGFWKNPARHLTSPVDAGSIVALRIAFGAIMAWEVWRYFQYGWIDYYWVNPEFNFTYAGFRWLEPWQGEGMYFHMIALGILALFIMVGFLYRISTVLFFFGFSYIFLLEKAHYLNHFYFIILLAFLMMFVPAHRTFSVDACLRKKIRSDTVPAWALWSLRAQLGIVYFYGGLAKINPDWLRGEPVRLWISDLDHFAVIGPHVGADWFVYGLAYGGLLFDLLIVPALLWKRTRWVAFGLAAFFHIMNSWIFHIGIFPWLSLAATTLFFRPDWPRRVAAWAVVRDEPEKTSEAAGGAGARTGSWEKPILVILGIHFFFQLVLPFRHLLYPGNVNWTEEGHRFSWRMKLRAKDAAAVFIARNPATGDIFQIDATERLNRRQIRKMSGRPDMILEFARYIAREMEANGIPNAEVRVRSMASLNGREPQIFIDPNVNLTDPDVKWGLAPSRGWVLPLTEPLRRSAEPEEAPAETPAGTGEGGAEADPASAGSDTPPPAGAGARNDAPEPAAP